MTAILTSPLKKNLWKVQSSFGQIPEKVSSRILLKGNLVSYAKFVWTLKRHVSKPWWKKLVEGPEIFDKMVEMIEKNEFFSKKRTFSTMFFSERLDCSSFDKLKRNFSENSRKMFAQYLEFARNTSFVWNNPHSFPPDIWNAVLITLLKLLSKVYKFSTQSSGNNGWSIFSRKNSRQFFRRGSRMQFWPVCWENFVRSLRNCFTLSNCFFVYSHIFLTYDLTDLENFLSKS